MNITENNIVMGQTVKSKSQALALLGRILCEQGFTVNNYTEALSLREAQVSTYLGGGIAIPHGLPAFKDDVLKTGVVLIHFADGVDWGDGEMVYLAVGIAAKSDEHLVILRRLAQALGDEADTKRQLMAAKTPNELLALLGQAPTQSVDTSLLVLESQQKAGDGEQLLLQAVTLLKDKAVIGEGFLASIVAKPWLKLGDHTYCVQSAQGVNMPALALVSADTTIYHAGKPLKYLLVIADHPRLDKNALDELLGRAITNGLGERYQRVCVSIPNRHGLHARPATALANLAKSLPYEVSVCVDGGAFVPATSLTKLLSLGAGAGATLCFKAEQGCDLSVLVEAVQSGLGDDIMPAKPQPTMPSDTTDFDKPLQAVVAAKGIALAKAWVVKDTYDHFVRTSDQPERERARLVLAIAQVNDDLTTLIANAKTQTIADIFVAHQAILNDESVNADVFDKINAGFSAEAAWGDTLADLASTQAALSDPLLAERAADLKDVGARVLNVLVGESGQAPVGEYVLVKEDVLPSDVLGLQGQVVGIVTAMGSQNSHSAIIARSLGVPALVGAGVGVLDIKNGTMLLLDAQRGQLVIDPDEDQCSQALAQQKKLQQKNAQAKTFAFDPATTTDGHTIKVMANVGDVSESVEAKDNGAEGVGLLRTEFVFMQHNKLPSKQQQIDDYRYVFAAMGERPVVARTLDVGGDKPLPYLTMKAEDNPFLGVRGVRLSLQRPDMLREQLIALLMAGQGSPLRIMFPMVGQLHEWQQAKAILDEVLREYPHDNLQVGMMIEVPSAAIMADIFAPYVDFFSIGTNDLTQYVLAIDRGHPVLSATADGLHPSVLRLIDMTVKAAHAQGKWVGVCGELGADEAGAVILIGLGVDELSVATTQVATTKAHIRTLNFATCQTLATQALTQSSAKMVRALINQ